MAKLGAAAALARPSFAPSVSRSLGAVSHSYSLEQSRQSLRSSSETAGPQSFAVRAVSAASAAFLAQRVARTASGMSRSRKVSAAAVATDAAAEVGVDPYLKARLEEMIALQPVIIFSKSWCPYCAKAKEALKQQGIEYALCELDTLGPEVEAQVQDVMGEMTGARSVPRVFFGGSFIGGGTETERLAAEGALKGLAEQALERNQRMLANKGDYSLTKSEEEWRAALDPKLYGMLRQRGTEAPGSHEYDQFLPKSGHFSCAGCNLPLYSASSKFASSCGWPVFDKCYGSDDLGQHVLGQPDGSGSLEIVCTRCGSHLGHVFYDSVTETNPNGERH
ncbi:unnamed protein product [Polarella glacialis]|uniref:MsrB domain-containing protein n=1 Tax=Polarella glacialis TaxID=89957 RepID=A0A813HHK4_POLGL|nr:unnamed protein product [Polarella glacialis]|mmetsp:Transcript_51704/g.83890  ORF Transcript_51704/g.83890 Transcript_51704/m.83890 type:complete len:335 (-) Transcript_51704:162-1166(-)|eukprot:CAMPEP_0115094426 /NCGR_PEP_ID=MMETSP0227-20121206/28346_1 /TAXON_ID=89957 /ORGANISM="Polarella glacialis, Strain CCMP 1383" /LENGTH=334 /DNA_ID=CAMNT_0002487417 /DNA_START=45 /DNA_END=1049 /DNA_ORIENTATION=+